MNQKLQPIISALTQLLDAEIEYWDAWLTERIAYAALQAAVGEVPDELRAEL